ncbi:hypothetical protein V1264_005819 [Littorina saxatilis]|uniref:Uncharacterized protein n=1 Tax=Littorina saxatilis TaxID=31220 RepID=A0AAN9B2E0_9CAEN
MMYARCLFLVLLLISIAGRNLIFSEDRVYHTTRQHTSLEKLNKRTGDMHLRPKYTRTKKNTYLNEESYVEFSEFIKSW